MKVLITSKGKDLNSQVDSRFGKSPYNLFIETVTMDYEADVNGYSKNYVGASVDVVQEAIQKGVEVVITGEVCISAREALENAGITVIENGRGTVKKVLEQLMEFEYKEVQFPST